MLIIRRLNCINTASGIVTLCRWPFGAQVARVLSNITTQVTSDVSENRVLGEYLTLTGGK
jgi:hypothetical protein